MSRDFDGVDDQINFGNTTFLDGKSIATFFIIFKLDTLGVSRRLIDKWGTSFGTDTSFLISEDDTSSDELILATYHSNSTFSIYVTTNANMTTQVWYSLVLTYDTNAGSGNQWKVYLNGNQISTSASFSGIGTIKATAQNLCIGRANATGNALDGIISEFAIWDVLLNRDEINLLGTSRIKCIPLSVRKNSLKIYSPLFGANPEIDYSINKYTGTITGSTTNYQTNSNQISTVSSPQNINAS